MPTPLIARAGDTLDELAWREAGLGPADLPSLLTANPGLADHGPTLPAGAVVMLPAGSTVAVPATLPLVQLWD
jgi:phage tail protein X